MLDAHAGAFAISRESFIALVSRKEEQLRKVFDDMDEDKNGYIDFTEFKRGWNKVHPNIAIEEEQVRRIFDDLDIDKSGTIEFDVSVPI